MARPVTVIPLIGSYDDGVDLLPLVRTSFNVALSSIGVTGSAGKLPLINVLGINASSADPISMQVNQLSTISSTKLTDTLYDLDMGYINDGFFVSVDRMVLRTDTPSSTAFIRLNCYFEPVVTC